MGDSSVCTACGAMLPLPDLAGLVTCPSCGRVTRSEATTPDSAGSGSGSWPPPPGGSSMPGGSTAWPPPPVAAPDPSDQWATPAPVAGAPPSAPPPTAVPGKVGAGKKIGCSVVPLVILIIVSAVIISAVRSCDISTPGAGPSIFDRSSNILTLSGSSTVLASDVDATDVAVIQQTTGNTTVRRLAVVRFTPEGSEQQWESEPLDDSVSRAEVAVVGDTLFAAYEDQLLALDRETGETRWKATLHDKVTIGCPSCFAALGDHLVVRTTDAYVTSYEVGSAEPVWEKRLRSTQGSVSVANDRLFVVDDPEAADQLTQVQLLDPATGSVTKTVSPSCPASGDTPWALELRPGDQIRAVPNSDDVVAIFGFGDGCAVRWAPESGAPRWATRVSGSSSFSQDDVLVGDEDLVAPSTGGPSVSLALADGAVHLLEGPADTTVEPVAIVGRTALGASATNRGTPKRGLVGWDLASGERLWGVRLPGDPQPVSSSPTFSSDALFEGSPRFVIQPTPDGANVVTFTGEPRTFSFSALDLADGTVGPPAERGLVARYETGTISVTVEAVAPERLLISIDTLLQALPPNGRGTVVAYPDGD